MQQRRPRSGVPGSLATMPDVRILTAAPPGLVPENCCPPGLEPGEVGARDSAARRPGLKSATEAGRGCPRGSERLRRGERPPGELRSGLTPVRPLPPAVTAPPRSPPPAGWEARSRAPRSAKLAANALSGAGAAHLTTRDLHAPHIRAVRYPRGQSVCGARGPDGYGESLMEGLRYRLARGGELSYLHRRPFGC